MFTAFPLPVILPSSWIRSSVFLAHPYLLDNQNFFRELPTCCCCSLIRSAPFNPQSATCRPTSTDSESWSNKAGGGMAGYRAAKRDTSNWWPQPTTHCYPASVTHAPTVYQLLKQTLGSAPNRWLVNCTRSSLNCCAPESYSGLDQVWLCRPSVIYPRL